MFHIQHEPETLDGFFLRQNVEILFTLVDTFHVQDKSCYSLLSKYDIL